MKASKFVYLLKREVARFLRITKKLSIINLTRRKQKTEI